MTGDLLVVGAMTFSFLLLWERGNLVRANWRIRTSGRSILLSSSGNVPGIYPEIVMRSRHLRFARIGILALFPTLWGISALNMAAQPSNWVTKQVISEGVQAELSYQRSSRSPKYRAVRLKILQAGRVVMDEVLPRQQNTDQPLLEQSLEGLQVKDLDGDRQPEVVVDLYTGGAHCCYYSLIYRFDGPKQSYTPTQHSWGNGFYRLADLNGDGVAEFESQDDRFAGRFASYIGSAYPVQIWRFEQGRMVDYTKLFPAQVEASATRNLLMMQKAGKTRVEAKGAIAAYLADKQSQGRGEEGWQLVQQLYQAEDKEKFLANVKKFLQDSGYGGDRS
jgi:hypothetical protein